MNFEDIHFWGKEAGIVLGTMIAAFAVSDRIVKIVLFFVERWKSRQLDARMRAIMIVPTLEEIARYSVQSLQPAEPYESNYRELLHEAKELEAARRKQYATEIRLLTLALSFAMAFVVIGIRFFAIAYGWD